MTHQESFPSWATLYLVEKFSALEQTSVLSCKLAEEAITLANSTTVFVSAPYFMLNYLILVDQLASVVSSLKKPAFCVADGATFGSASAFLTGQWRTTTTATVFAVPDVLVGFFPDCGILYPWKSRSLLLFLWWIRKHKLAPLNEVGRYIALTGRRLNHQGKYRAYCAHH